MGKRTSLYSQHHTLGAKLVDFSGWDMPLHYGSQLHEHREVRQNAGLFDVSHMLVVDVDGVEAEAYLRRLLANDVGRIASVTGKALYTAMLNDSGGVIDDLMVYNLGAGYRAVLNCANADKDMEWMRRVGADYDVSIRPQNQLCLLALQGPRAESYLAQVFPAQARAIEETRVFHSLWVDDCFVARTGYTGEDGFEIALPAERAAALWQSLIDLKVQPCGLGARDTLRIEAGLNLYGHEMDENVSPLEANMAWTIAWQPDERHFVGRDALEQQQALGQIQQQLVGLVMDERGVLRSQQAVSLQPPARDVQARGGTITSGTFSPTLGKSIALARVPNGVVDSCWVELRRKWVEVRVVPPRFVRHGKSLADV